MIVHIYLSDKCNLLTNSKFEGMTQPERYSESFLVKIRAGNLKAWTKLYNDFNVILFHKARQLTNNTEVALDIVAEIFATFWTIKEKFNTEFDIRAYMYVSCRNRAYDHLRDNTIENKHREGIVYNLYGPDPTTSPAENPAMAEIARLQIIKGVHDQINKLPGRQASVLKGYLQGKSTLSIAQELGISEQTVRNIKGMAVRKLRHFYSFKKLAQFVLFYSIQRWLN